MTAFDFRVLGYVNCDNFVNEAGTGAPNFPEGIKSTGLSNVSTGYAVNYNPLTGLFTYATSGGGGGGAWLTGGNSVSDGSSILGTVTAYGWAMQSAGTTIFTVDASQNIYWTGGAEFSVDSGRINIGVTNATAIAIGTVSTTAITMDGNSLIANFNGSIGCTINASGTDGLTLSTTSSAPLTIENNGGNLLIEMRSSSAGQFSIYGRNTIIDNNAPGQTAYIWTTYSGTVIFGNPTNTIALDPSTLNVFAPNVNFTSLVTLFEVGGNSTVITLSASTYSLTAATSITENAPTMNIATSSTSTALNIGSTSTAYTVNASTYAALFSGMNWNIDSTVAGNGVVNIGLNNLAKVQLGNLVNSVIGLSGEVVINVSSGNNLQIIGISSALKSNVLYWDSTSNEVSYGSLAGNVVDETGTSATMATNTVYFADNAGLVTLQLPTGAAVGDFVEIDGKGAGLWKISQAASQQIFYGNTSSTAGTGGSVASTLQYDCIKLRALTAGATSTWVVISSVGNLNVT